LDIGDCGWETGNRKLEAGSWYPISDFLHPDSASAERAVQYSVSAPAAQAVQIPIGRGERGIVLKSPEASADLFDFPDQATRNPKLELFAAEA
jgi:hypothetical protein